MKIYKNFADYLRKRKDGENGCTQEFLNGYYDGDEKAFENDNATNKECYNCFNCRDCRGCRGCAKCTDCSFCTSCKDCRDCTDCRDCEDCTGCAGRAFCKNKKGLKNEDNI